MSETSRRTIRQRIFDLLMEQELSSRGLATLLDIPVREVEGHLPHVIKTIRRHSDKQFLLIPSRCQDCGFLFEQRTRLTPPTRCPQCRSEFISPPRYSIRQRL